MVSKLKHLLKLHGHQHGTGDTNRSLSINCSGSCRTQGAKSTRIYLDMSASFSFSLSLFSLSSLPPHFFPSLFLLSFLLPFSLPFSFPPFSPFFHFFLPTPRIFKDFSRIDDYFIIPPLFFFFFSSPLGLICKTLPSYIHCPFAPSLPAGNLTPQIPLLSHKAISFYRSLRH